MAIPFRLSAKSRLMLTLLFFTSQSAISSDKESQTLDHSVLLDLGTQFCEDFRRVPSTQLRETITQTATRILNAVVSSELSAIEIRGRNIGQRLTLSVPNSVVLDVRLLTPPARPVQTVLTDYANQVSIENNKPSTQLVIDSTCELQQAQQIVYTENQAPEFVQAMTADGDNLVATGERSWINRPLPKLAPISPPRFRVAIVDSGVNYQLPEIAHSLARDAQGDLIGFDFWDMDKLPYDANPARSPYVVQRHGTRTASIIIAEAPGIAIVPYRYPRSDMSRMKELIEHAQASGVRIIGMPLGSNDYKSWVTFDRTARRHSDILFIVSAGNNGRDIDINGVYPAAMDTPNMLVVTSSDDFVTPAERTNYGRISVDYMVPAENIDALDYNGSKVKVSGSSYAVSRVVALAARALNRRPALSTSQLMQEIYTHSVRANTGKYVAKGYLGDPLASPRILKVTADVNKPKAMLDNTYQLPVTVNIMDQRWNTNVIDAAFERMNRIFAQCDITATVEKWQIIEAPKHLKDLSTGHALTLRRKLGTETLAVFFANDTKMNPQFDAEAFGEGNTRNRPWMTNTLWLTYGIDDTGIALAHELFHIVANDGGHSQADTNLMRGQTDPANTVLTNDQCVAMISNGLETGLLLAAE